jgi:hypothetical protein
MMRKSLLRMIIGLTSFTVISCGMIGFTQVRNEPPPSGSAKDTGTAIPEQQPNQTATSQDAIDSQPQSQLPTPIPTVDPLVSAQSCVAKTWEIAGLDDYVIAAVPPELAAEYDLKYEETKGDALFKLTPGGQITLLADDLQMIFSAQAYVFSVPVTVRIDGTATGKYTLDRTTLTITNVDTSGLDVSAKALGEDLVDPSQIMNSIPFLTPPNNTARYFCQGDVLILELSGYSEDIPPLVLHAAE